MGKTESGRQSGGGCSKESRKTLVNVAQEYERKIGREQIARGEDSSPQKDAFSDFGSKDAGNFFTQFIDLLKGFLFGGKPGSKPPDLTRCGPGGCKSETECQAYCTKPENIKECSKFAPPGEER